MKKRLARNFYTQPTLKVAKEMLGKYLVRKIGNRKLIGRIVETEAYIGPKDKASHAFGNKKTARNQAEWLIGGHIYIYLVYGMYWQFNISTGKEGKPECVLIRALEPITQNSQPKAGPLRQESRVIGPRAEKINNLVNGPGKLCRWLKLDKSFYGEDLTKSKRIWLAASISSRRASPKGREEKVKPSQIVASKRIGIDYAKEWAKKPWRFYIKGNHFVSKY